MSVDLYVYVPYLSHEMIPAIINRIKTAGVPLNSLVMRCEIAMPLLTAKLLRDGIELAVVYVKIW